MRLPVATFAPCSQGAMRACIHRRTPSRPTSHLHAGSHAPVLPLARIPLWVRAHLSAPSNACGRGCRRSLPPPSPDRCRSACACGRLLTHLPTPGDAGVQGFARTCTDPRAPVDRCARRRRGVAARARKPGSEWTFPYRATRSRPKDRPSRPKTACRMQLRHLPTWPA